MFAIEAWRDYEPSVTQVPGVYQGVFELPLDGREYLDAMYTAGIRMIRFCEEVRPADNPVSFVGFLRLLGDATAIGMRVLWSLASDRTGNTSDWRPMAHLHPPTEVTEDPGGHILRAWRSGFSFNGCTSRRGPGFIQVHDKRGPGLQRFTIANPRLLTAVETARHAVPMKSLPADCVASLIKTGLFADVNGVGWWMPYQMRRRPRAKTN